MTKKELLEENEILKEVLRRIWGEIDTLLADEEEEDSCDVDDEQD